MRRLEELMRQMCQAAKAIGNSEMENKFSEGNYTLYRLLLIKKSKIKIVMFSCNFILLIYTSILYIF